MKCDDIENKDYNNGMTAYELMEENGLVNTAKMVKDTIAELKAKLAEKDDEIDKQKWRGDEWAKACNQKDEEIESLKASHYAEMVDAGMRERRLRRALWLARAWFCGRSSEYFSGMASRCKIGQEDFYREVSERATKYMKLSYKCQARAEKYK